jgi:hypothetical protein
MLFPLFVIVLAFIAVNFIRPGVLAVLDQRAAKEVKFAELAAVEKTASNVGSLADSRESLLGSEDGRSVMSYLPTGPDHDRIVDILNYLAFQSGAVIGDVSFEDGKNIPSEVPQSQVVAADGTIIQEPPSVPVPMTFSVSVDMSGSYDSLKSFMEKVSSVDRLRAISSFSLKKESQSLASGTDGQAVPDDGVLSATFDVEFAYLPEASYPGAHLLPVFSSTTFDIGSVRQMMAADESIPALPEPTLPGRRADPFKY